MERGLLWLPLLAIFIWLAWAGWNEFQKVSAYQQWAQDFEPAKYDILAVVGVKDQTLVWGRPTRRGPTKLQSIDLSAIEHVGLCADGQPVDAANPPQKARQWSLRLGPLDQPAADIPFTDLAIAQAWHRHLQERIQANVASQPS